MKKVLTIAALIALLAVPFMAVSAEDNDVPPVTLCHARPPDTAANGWRTKTIPREAVFSQGHASEHDADIIPPFGDYAGKNWDADGQAILENGCEVPPPPPEACDGNDSTTRVVQSVVKEPASDWVWDERAQNFWRWLRVTTHIHAISDLDGSICDEGDVISREKETREADQPGVDINVGCNEDDVATISGSLDLGDFGVALVIEGRGSTHVIDSEGAFGPILARPGTYTWTIYGLGDNGRYVISSGEFEVDDCTPTPPPGDCSNTGDNICPGDEPPEHPPTGGEMNALPVVIGLAGYALAGIGGSILFMKRRASR